LTHHVCIHQLQKTFNVKDKHLEKAMRDKEQIEQDLERMKRKIESMSQSDNPAEEELRQECEELRVRIKRVDVSFYVTDANASIFFSFSADITQMQCMSYKVPITFIVTLYAYFL
jgi:archaellum component FlaC